MAAARRPDSHLLPLAPAAEPLLPLALGGILESVVRLSVYVQDVKIRLDFRHQPCFMLLSNKARRNVYSSRDGKTNLFYKTVDIKIEQLMNKIKIICFYINYCDFK